MDNEFTIKISIPTDDYGYILLKCSHCGTFFKSTPDDIEDDRVLEIYCPSCGLISDNYLTEEVVELAMAMGYSSSRSFQDKVKGFNDRVVMVLIRHIERYLTKIGIEMGIDEKVTYSIAIENGQVNIANDNSTTSVA
ncbi:hypothetical protein ACR6HW_16565 [Fusibacter sp. JL298sf-3]